MSKDFGMPEFMVDVNLHDVNSDEFLKLIPSQRAIVNDLFYNSSYQTFSHISLN